MNAKDIKALFASQLNFETYSANEPVSVSSSDLEFRLNRLAEILEKEFNNIKTRVEALENA